MKNKHIGKLSKVSSEISTSSELIQAESRSGKYEISIICDIGWHIEDLPEYITASDIHGNKGRTVTFTFSPNNSLTEVRSGSFKIINSAGNYKVIEYIQNSAIIEYEYVFSIKNNSIEFGYEAESKELNIESYKIPSINDIVSGDNIEVSYYASESDWISVENNKIFVTENNSFERSETITITQYESGKTVSVDIHQDQAIIEYKYRIESESNVVNAPAAPSTQHLIINAYCDELLNGNIISTQSVNVRSGQVVYWDSIVSFDFSNNTTENVITSSKTFTPNILSDKPSSYDIPTLVITTKQDAGYKVYSDVETSLSYQSAAPAAGGICSPTLSYSQTYTWNGYGDSLSVDQSSFTKSYSLASTTGASINTSTGAITWESNKSTSSRTSSNITVTVTGLGGKSKQTTATCQQNAGYYTYGDITISSFSYTAVSAIGGNSSPSIVYSQPYGWNGETSGAGSINGNGDDNYTTYAITTAQTGLSIASDTGIITWTKNNATSGSVDSARSGAVTATVTRNGKTATKSVTVTQNAETVSSYGAWTFSISPSTTSIAATGGSSTITLSRPTRTITYDTGDTRTETATSGTFAITRSNSSFTLSTASVSMTSSSLPTFTVSIGATGAAAASAISSTVTAAFTASNPTTGTTTASKTTGSITRAASSITATNYRFSTFSLAKTSFTAAAGSTTLSMVVQRKYTYTGNQEGSWTTITPASGSLSVTAGTGGSVGSITYGSTSTCTISVAAYTNTSSNRTISISGNYNSGSATSSVSITQTKDATTTITYGTPTISSFGYSAFPASGATYTPSIAYSQSRTQNYVSGNTAALSALTSGATGSYSMTAATGFTLNSSSTGSITAASRGTTYGASARTTSVSATVTMNGKTSAAKSCTISQGANTITISSVTSTPGSLTNTSFGAGTSTINITASGASASAKLKFTSGSEVTTAYNATTYGTWTFHGYSASSNQTYATIGATNYNYVAVTMATRGTTYSASTRSATITRSEAGFTFTLSSTYGGASKRSSGTSCTCTVTQAANVVTAYSLPQPLGVKYDKLIPAGGGTATPSFSYQQIATYSSGSTSTLTSGASISYARAYGVRNDPEFYNGYNSVHVYDNASSGKTTLTRVTSGYPSGIPNISGACIKISNTGSGTTPGLGGWYFAYSGTAGQTYICTFDAYVPVGRNIIFATNSIGSGGTSTWLTPNAGLGKWATYSYQVYFGTNPSSSFFFYLDGAAGSSSSPVTWWMSDAHLAQVSNISASSPTVNTSTGAVTLGSLGTTAQSATANAYGTMCATITMNGKTSKIVLAPTQQANTVSSYGAVSVSSNGSASDIPAAGGSRSGSGGTGTQTVTYTSGSTRAGAVSCGTYSSVSANSLGTTEKARTAIGTSQATLTGEGGKTATAKVTVYQAANSRSVTSIYLVPYQPDSSWITTVTNGNWNTVPASGGYLKSYGYYTYTYTSGGTKDELATYDAALTFSGSPSYITKHTNGGYYVANRGTSTGDARSTTATWTAAGKTSPGKTVTQAANSLTNSYYGASTTWNTPSISIGTGITAAGGSATVTHSQTGSTSYYYYYTSGSTSGPYTKAETGSTSIAIQTNGNSRFGLTGNVLSHSSMTTNETTDTCVVKVTGSGSKTNTASVSATNTCSIVQEWAGATAQNDPDFKTTPALTAAGGDFTLSWFATNTYRVTKTWSSGTTSYDNTTEIVYPISWEFYPYSTPSSEFSLSGNILSMQNLGNNGCNTGSKTVAARLRAIFPCNDSNRPDNTFDGDIDIEVVNKLKNESYNPQLTVSTSSLYVSWDDVYNNYNKEVTVDAKHYYLYDSGATCAQVSYYNCSAMDENGNRFGLDYNVTYRDYTISSRDLASRMYPKLEFINNSGGTSVKYVDVTYETDYFYPEITFSGSDISRMSFVYNYFEDIGNNTIRMTDSGIEYVWDVGYGQESVTLYSNDWSSGLTVHLYNIGSNVRVEDAFANVDYISGGTAVITFGPDSNLISYNTEVYVVFSDMLGNEFEVDLRVR